MIVAYMLVHWVCLMEFKFEFEFHLVESLFKISKTFFFSILSLPCFWPIFACSVVTQSPLPLLDLFCLVRRFTPPSPPGRSPAPLAAYADPSCLSHHGRWQARPACHPCRRTVATPDSSSSPGRTRLRLAPPPRLGPHAKAVAPALLKAPPSPVRGVPEP
jgi:hypothetical protein